MGRNPFLLGFWLKSFRSDDRWLEHPIEIEEGATLNSKIMIYQDGEGNDARKIRIDGTNAQGVKGYYYKSMADKSKVWPFKAYTDHN